MTGCHLFRTNKVTRPLSYLQQVEKIKNIVPLGTPRDEAIRKLEEAGIDGDFSSVSRSIYYCERWNRENGKQWELNVSLLFDAQGQFYRTKHSDFDANLTTENLDVTSNTTGGQAQHRNGNEPFSPTDQSPTRQATTSGSLLPPTGPEIFDRSPQPPPKDRSRSMERGAERRMPFGTP